MAVRTTQNSLKGIIVVDGKTLDIRIPKGLIEIFKGEPRFILKKLEWYGIHPIPFDMLSKELKPMNKDYTFIAVPKQMLK